MEWRTHLDQALIGCQLFGINFSDALIIVEDNSKLRSACTACALLILGQ